MQISIAVVIPNRAGRKVFMKQCLKMINRQTLKPDHIEIVDYAPLSLEKDITQRYKYGYNQCRSFDVVLFMENDDYYHPQYIEYMVSKWIENGRPQLLGMDHTIYYHLHKRAYFTMHHITRSSAMNTLLTGNLNFTWPADNDPYTDIHIWMKAGLKGLIITPDKEYCIGMKHGVGLCGGGNHSDGLHRFINDDQSGNYLKSNIDPDSLQFYLDFVHS